MKHLNAIAIIPARGGSQRIPKKNIRPFLGQPIIKYSIDAAEKCRCFDEIMVSTESREVAEISKKFGVIVPFMRSRKNASDLATISDVMLEVVLKYKKQGVTFDYFCCIFATVPSLVPSRISEAFEILKSTDTDVVLPVVEFEFPVQRRLTLNGRFLEMVERKNEAKRSQDLPPRYHDAGRFVWVRTKPFLKKRTLFLKKVTPLIMPRVIVQDIDTIEDWKLAEIKYILQHNLLDRDTDLEQLKKLVKDLGTSGLHYEK